MSEYTTTTEPETANPPAPAGWETAPTSTEDSPPAEAPAVSPPAEVKPSHILLLPPALAGLAKVCPAESPRYGLTGVRLEVSGPGVFRAEATDGRILARVEGRAEHSPEDYPSWPELESAPNGAAYGIIPAGAWTAAFKGVPKQGRYGKPILSCLAAVVGADVATLASTDLDTRNLAQPRLLGRRWPMTDEVFPKRQPAAVVKVNAGQLVKLLQLAAAFGADGGDAVTIELRRPSDPVILRAKNGSQQFSGVIMPLS